MLDDRLCPESGRVDNADDAETGLQPVLETCGLRGGQHVSMRIVEIALMRQLTWFHGPSSLPKLTVQAIEAGQRLDLEQMCARTETLAGLERRPEYTRMRVHSLLPAPRAEQSVSRWLRRLEAGPVRRRHRRMNGTDR